MSQFDLVVTLGNGRNYEFLLPEGTYVLGQNEDCEICLQSNTISARHSRLTLETEQFFIEDLGSDSGTKVGERSVKARQSFVYPASLQLGSVSLILSQRALPSSQATAAVADTMAESQSDSAQRIIFKKPGRASLRIAKYKVGNEIAKGGMGSILEAEDSSLQRVVAMKVLLPQMEDSDDSRQRFVREATILGALEHPNIVPIHDLGQAEDGRVFYTMKHVNGRTLSEILSAIKKGDQATIQHYTLERLLTVFGRVCDAIAFTHYKGIIHRDLKPDNIMVGEFGEVLVMDWGIAKIIGDQAQAAEEAARSSSPVVLENMPDNLTLDGAVVGSPQYMSPEQACGRLADIDAQSDVFSLGGMLYSILVLRPPVSGKTTEELLTNIAKGNIEPPESFNPTGRGKPADKARNQYPHCPGGRIPGALSAVAMRAMTVDKSERYPNVQQLAADVDAYQRGFATSAEEASTIGHLWLMVNRHKRELLIGILIWIGISLALQGGKALGTLAQSLGVVVWVVVLVAIYGLFARARKREQKALAATAHAQQERDRAAASQTSAEQARTTAQHELDSMKAKLASAQLAVANALCQAGEGPDALLALDRVPEEYRAAKWNNLFKRAQELSKKRN